MLTMARKQESPSTAVPVTSPRPPRRPERMDEESFRTVCEQHVPSLLGYVTRLTFGDRAAAEDVVQETLLRAWQHPETLSPERASIRPWLFAVARNLVIDRRRAKAKRPAEVSDAVLATTPTATDDLEAALTSWTVQHALAGLSADHRSVLVEVYYRGRGTAEAAERLGVPPGTVKSRLHYGMRALRLALEERGVTR